MINLRKDTILYAIDDTENTTISELVIDDVKEENAFDVRISYDVTFHYMNDLKKYHFNISEKSKLQKDVVLCKAFACGSTANYTHLLICDNRKKLILYYIHKLQKSLTYQREVAKLAVNTIKDIEHRIDLYKKLL